ncbi:MAG: hypothetical protein LBU23_13635, partial [Planctomycetota bacterium]|nr:hypothetical protein [Planctomycetota bacterium]
AAHREARRRAEAELPRLAAACGESEFLRAEAIRRFRAAWFAKYPGGDLAVVRGLGEGRPAGLAEVIAELAGGSLFGSDKLVLVYQADRLIFPGRGGQGGAAPEKGNARELAFLERVENLPERTWLFLETASLPKNRPLGKRLAAAAFPIPCPTPNQRDIPAWLAERAGELGKAIAPAAAELLTRAHGADMGALAGEMEKLAVFAGDAAEISAGMAELFMTGSVEFDIFGFGNAIEAGNRRQAVSFARRIAVQGTRDRGGRREGGEDSAHKVLSMLAGTLRLLLLAKVALVRRLAPAAFAAEEKLSPMRAARVMEAAAGFELPRLRRMLARMAGEMRRLHDTGGDALLSLETMAAALTER